MCLAVIGYLQFIFNFQNTSYLQLTGHHGEESKKG